MAGRRFWVGIGLDRSLPCSPIARHRPALQQVEDVPSAKAHSMSSPAPKKDSHRMARSCKWDSMSSLRQKAVTRSSATASSTVPPSGARAQRDVLLAGRAPQHTALFVERVVVRHDEAGDDRFAEPPGRFDDALVGAVERILREHHARAVRLDHALHDDCRRAARRPCRACAGRRGPIPCARTRAP